MPNVHDSPEQRVLLCSSYSDFSDALVEFCDDHGIDYRMLDTKDPWMRDFLIDGASHLYVRNKVKPHLRDLFDELTPEDTVEESPTRVQRDYYAHHGPVVSDQSRRPLEPAIFTDTTSCKSTTRPLEGGNYFDVSNRTGERVIVMNRDIFTIEEAQLKKKEEHLGSKQYRAMTRSRHTKDRYERIFGTKDIIYIPSICYHLDLQMAYIGKGIFLLQSFQEMKEHFPEDFKTIEEQFQDLFGKSVLDLLQPKLDMIKKQLEKAGFKVIPVAGTLYDKNSSVWNGEGLYSAVLNGIALYDEEEEQDYFVTVETPVVAHKKYLSDICKQHGISVEFLPMNRSNAEQTAFYVGDLHGGLRCQTNMIRSSRIKPLEQCPVPVGPGSAWPENNSPYDHDASESESDEANASVVKVSPAKKVRKAEPPQPIMSFFARLVG